MNSVEIALSEWITQVIGFRSWETFDDLHVDQLYNGLRQEDWVAKSLEALRLCRKLLDQRDSAFVVVLGIRLTASVEPSIGTILDVQSIQEQLDDSPPSLYLFPEDFQNWFETRSESRQVTLKDRSEAGEQYFLSQVFSEEDGEYGRALFAESRRRR